MEDHKVDGAKIEVKDLEKYGLYSEKNCIK